MTRNRAQANVQQTLFFTPNNFKKLS